MNGNVRKLVDKQGSEFYPTTVAKGVFLEDNRNIEDALKDIILKSPNGTKYKIAVSDSGLLSAVLIP